MQSKETGAFCHGDAPTLADICLCRRFTTRGATRFRSTPIHNRAHRCGGTALPAFAKRRAEKQPDAA